MSDRTRGLKPFQKGQSGNPGGKPVGARNKLSASFLNAVIDDFEANGPDAIQKLRSESPVKYCELIAGLLPVEKNVNVESNHTVTHKSEPVSDTARWIEEALRGRANRQTQEPVSDGPVLSAEIRTRPN